MQTPLRSDGGRPGHGRDGAVPPPRKPPGARQVGSVAVEVLGGVVTGLAVMVGAAGVATPLNVTWRERAAWAVEGGAAPVAACICAVLGWRAGRRPAHAAWLYGFAALIAGMWIREIALR